MSGKARQHHSTTDDQPFPTGTGWLLGLVGIILLAFSLSVALMFSY